MYKKGRIGAAALIAGLFILSGCVAAAGRHDESAAFRTGFAPGKGLQLYYEIHGEAKGKTPLVLLHGGGSTIQTSFGAILPALAKNRQVIAIEQQGHGHTPDVDRPFSFADSAEDTVAVLRYLGIGKADFLGYSNGGHIALEIVLKDPEMVRRIVFESIMFNRDGSDPRFWDSFDQARLEDMPLELREAYLNTSPHPEQLPIFFAKSVQRMKAFEGWTPDQIRSIKSRSLVLIGDHDIVRPEHALLMFHLLPDARLAILPDTDHIGIVKQADLLVPIIQQFLEAP